MNTFVAIRYTDALYYTTKEIEFTEFPVHIALGEIIESNERHTTLCFTRKNNLPEEGLTFPTHGIILEDRKDTKTSFVIPKKDSQLGVYWNDVVHFINGNIPTECTPMYTEGIVYSVTQDALILNKPLTLNTGKRIKNHPEDIETTFVAIPISFITSIQIYPKT